jgi:hypothetical protein
MAKHLNDMPSQVISTDDLPDSGLRLARVSGTGHLAVPGFVDRPDLPTQVVNIHHLTVRNSNDSPISGGKFLPPATLQTDHSGYECS